MERGTGNLKTYTHTERQTQQEWIHTPCSVPFFSTSNCFWDCLFLLKSVYCEDMHNRRHTITGGTPTDTPTSATNTMTNGTRHWESKNLHTHTDKRNRNGFIRHALPLASRRAIVFGTVFFLLRVYILRRHAQQTALHNRRHSH